MGATAKLTVTGGPDRGQVFPLDGELVHVGSGADNQVVLTDPAVQDYHVSIVRRNGRYAIYTPLPSGVEVDGNSLPAESWVWLPAAARIRLSERTWLQFSNGNGGANAASVSHTSGGASAPAEANGGTATAVATPRVKPPATKPAARPPEKPQRPAAKRADKTDHNKGGTVARFITDRTGDTLVRLGEDGHLPELTLAEGEQRTRKEKQPRQSSPLLVYVGVGMSLLVSLGLLFIEDDPSGTSSGDLARARQEIREFYGQEGTELRPHQRLLREARLARSRGDRAAERRAYRKVLDLLHSEDNNRLTGLTGSPRDDERLRRLIATLMSQ